MTRNMFLCFFYIKEFYKKSILDPEKKLIFTLDSGKLSVKLSILSVNKVHVYKNLDLL